MVNEVKLMCEDGKVLVSSRVVSQDFNKMHKNVIRDVENLIESDGSKMSHQMFIESSYENRGKQYKEYLMNRDGFSLLVMGFTGKEALQWKLKYIEAFNMMEEELKNRVPQLTRKQQLQLQILNGTELERIGALKEYELEVTAPLLNTIEKQTPKVEYFDNVLLPKDEDGNRYKTVTDIANDLGISGRKLNELLHEKGVQYKQSGSWKLYSNYYYLVKEHYCDYDINQYGQVLKWSEKGRKFLLFFRIKYYISKYNYNKGVD